jgi:hypothetical protein
LILQITLHNLKINMSSKIAIETSITLEVNGVEHDTRKCPPGFVDPLTRLINVEHVLRIKCDDKTAKRKLIVKVHALKDDMQKLVALH